MEIGFLEDFALADDRGAALEQLIPGTEDHYFYGCLHLQQTGRLDEVPELMAVWLQRHGHTSRYAEVMHRQALLLHPRDPAAAYEHLRYHLGLTFSHQRREEEGEPEPSDWGQAHRSGVQQTDGSARASAALTCVEPGVCAMRF